MTQLDWTQTQTKQPRLGRRRLVLWIPPWIVEDNGDERGVVVLKGTRVSQVSYQALLQGVRVGDPLSKVHMLSPEAEIMQTCEKNLWDITKQFLDILASYCPNVEALKKGLVWAPLGSNISAAEETILMRNICEAITQETGREVWVGIANGMAAAVAASRRNLQLPPKETIPFLQSLSIKELVDFLPTPQLLRYQNIIEGTSSVGISSVADLHRFSFASLQNRFGSQAKDLWKLSFGGDIPQSAVISTPNLVEAELTLADKVTALGQLLVPLEKFSSDFCQQLRNKGQNLTYLLVEIADSDKQTYSKAWYIPQGNDQAAIVKRIIWQIRHWSVEKQIDNSECLDVFLESVRLKALEVTSLNNTALWGNSAEDDKISQLADRLQMIVGQDNVVRPAIVAGRNPRERTEWISWGHEYPATKKNGRWEGAICEAPLVLFDHPGSVRLVGAYQDNLLGSIWVSKRGILTGTLLRLIVEEQSRYLAAGSYRVKEVLGPWVHARRWWESKGTNSTRCFIRVKTLENKDILLVQVAKKWYLEGLYMPVTNGEWKR